MAQPDQLEMKSIVIAEDENITRLGIRLILEGSPHYRLVGEAEDGKKAVQLIRETTPDLLILDIMLPGLLGFEVARQVREFTPNTRILVLSSHDTQIYVKEALQAGADGYVLKGSSPKILFEAIDQVLSGKQYLCPPLSKQPLGVEGQAGQANDLDPFETLTSRERLVLQLAAQGSNSSEIGDRLHISPRTVETHRANLMRKLELHSQTELVLYAIRKGLVKAV